MKSNLSLWVLLICLFNFCQSMDRRRNKICYQAMTCIHTAREKCGVNSQGTFRRFYDSCDILEFNCLKGTDYIKTAKENCNRLPPIDNEAQVDSNYNNNEPNQDFEPAPIQNYEQTPNQGGNDVPDNVQPNNEPATIPTENQDDTAIDGEIAINDDGSIEGSIIMDMDETDQVGAENKPVITQPDDQDGGSIEGEIEIDDEGNIEGDIEIERTGKESPAGDVLQKQEKTGTEGTIIINEKNIKKRPI